MPRGTGIYRELSEVDLAWASRNADRTRISFMFIDVARRLVIVRRALERDLPQRADEYARDALLRLLDFDADMPEGWMTRRAQAGLGFTHQDFIDLLRDEVADDDGVEAVDGDRADRGPGEGTGTEGGLGERHAGVVSGGHPAGAPPRSVSVRRVPVVCIRRDCDRPLDEGYTACDEHGCVATTATTGARCKGFRGSGYRYTCLSHAKYDSENRADVEAATAEYRGVWLAAHPTPYPHA